MGEDPTHIPRARRADVPQVSRLTQASAHRDNVVASFLELADGEGEKVVSR